MKRPIWILTVLLAGGPFAGALAAAPADGLSVSVHYVSDRHHRGRHVRNRRHHRGGHHYHSRNFRRGHHRNYRPRRIHRFSNRLRLKLRRGRSYYKGNFRRSCRPYYRYRR